MSLPNQIIPNSTYMVTRRTYRRHFFLRPDNFITKLFMYCLAYAASKFGILVHCAVVSSNHWHAVITDCDGVVPKFLHSMHMLTAKAVNLFRGRWEAMWSSTGVSLVRLETPQDTLDKMVYVATNPVKDGLVSKSSDWPGLLLAPHTSADEMTAYRPNRFFRRNGRPPRKTSLTLSKPPGFDDMPDAQFRALFAARVAEREQALRNDAARTNKKFMGKKKILRQDWRSAPKTREPRRNLNPRIACRDKTLRIAAIQRRAAFLRDYRVAYRRWQNGDRTARFPHGTYALRVNFNANCHPPT